MRNQGGFLRRFAATQIRNLRMPIPKTAPKAVQRTAAPLLQVEGSRLAPVRADWAFPEAVAELGRSLASLIRTGPGPFKNSLLPGLSTLNPQPASRP
jgi:hypothetical protein